MQKMQYDELFKATLGMFALTVKDGQVPNSNYIKTIFEEVLKAYTLCQESFNKHPETPESTYEERDLKKVP